MSKRVLGVDLGYGFVKVAGEGRRVIFPSVVGVGQSIKYRSELSDYRKAEDNLQVTIDGRRFFVGELAVRQSGTACRSLDQDRVRDRNARVLFLTSLGLFAQEGRQGFNVVTGLPTNYYGGYSDGLAETFRGDHEVLMQGDGEVYRAVLEVEKVRIVPQPFGTLYDRVLDEGGRVTDESLARARVGVVDIGFKTADFVVADGLEFVDRLSGSKLSGLQSAYDMMAERLAQEFGVHKESYELDRVVETGSVKVAGRPHDVSEWKGDAFRALSEKILMDLDSMWDYRELDQILITGGGGQALAEYLVPEFPNAVVVDGAQFANARGFQKLGARMFATPSEEDF